MITVYSHPSTRGLRITWMLEEMGHDYSYHFLDFAKGDLKSPEFLAVNPSGKIPAITDDDFTLTESAAIVTYLGDNYDKKGLVPKAGTQARGRYDQWSYFAMAELEQGLWTIGKHKFALPKEYQVKEVIPSAQWEFQKALKLLSQGLGDQDYILGDNFSAADILLGQTLFWGMKFEQVIEQDNIIAYVDRLQKRPALTSAIEREQAELV